MGKKSIIKAIQQIEMDSGSWDDDQLEQLKLLDLKELEVILKEYDNWEEYASKKKSKPTKVTTAKQGGIIKKYSSGGAARRGYGKARS